ncbi:unnamed protein product, partial [Nippostrongylus brasiliensis]|uniref:Histidine kinase n=1 Tax=Nippostrongylus brasiliensis TaxID=27835 RepID=A0A0N4YZ79_NIPBR
MSFSADIQAALEDLDRCDVSTILHAILPKLDSIDAALKTLLERSAPRSSCALCTVEE